MKNTSKSMRFFEKYEAYVKTVLNRKERVDDVRSFELKLNGIAM